jgi:hypothetical protein
MWTKERARALIATLTAAGAIVVGALVASPDTYHDLAPGNGAVESVTTPDTTLDTYHDL